MSTFAHRTLRYFWDPEPRNEDPASVIWCLGKQYHTRLPGRRPSPYPQSLSSEPSSFSANVSAAFTANNGDAAATWPTAFLDDFETRIWMTYRTDFFPIPRSPSQSAVGRNVALSSPAAALHYAGKLLTGHAGEGFSSDVGWGCMIRSAQSVLANALLTLHLGRGKRASCVF